MDDSERALGLAAEIAREIEGARATVGARETAFRGGERRWTAFVVSQDAHVCTAFGATLGAAARKLVRELIAMAQTRGRDAQGWTIRGLVVGVEV